MRAGLLSILAAVVLVPALAHAEEHERRFAIALDASLLMLGGDGQRATGGFTVWAKGRREWQVSERARLSAGVDLGAGGFGGGTHWAHVLAGPRLGVMVRPAVNVPIAVGLEGGVDGGRIAVCGWLCSRWWGVFPVATARVEYASSEAIAVRGRLSARYVSTGPWSGVSWEPGVEGVWRF